MILDRHCCVCGKDFTQEDDSTLRCVCPDCDPAKPLPVEEPKGRITRITQEWLDKHGMKDEILFIPKRKFNFGIDEKEENDGKKVEERISKSLGADGSEQRGVESGSEHSANQGSIESGAPVNQE